MQEINTINTIIQLRNDTAENWAAAGQDVTLMAGEVAVELVDGKAKLKVGNGENNFNELDYFAPEAQIFQSENIAYDNTQDDIEIIAELTTGKTLSKGDCAIIKRQVSEASGSYIYTSYVYDGSVWAAMDGNYSADNIYFNEDFTFTTAIGTVTSDKLVNGSTTKEASGKSLKAFLASLFAEEKDPTKTEPSVTTTLVGAGSYEVGTKLTPTFSASFEDGAYTYGPEPTGATVSTWSVTSTDGENWTSNSGTCKEIIVGDDTNYSVTAKATHTQGDIPLTNLQNECADTTKRIAAGDKSKKSSSITGYRSYFYGVLNDTENLTSNKIRELINGGAYTKGTTLTVKVNGNTSAKRIVVAIPSTRDSKRTGVTKVMKTDGLATEITATYTKTVNAVEVEGKDGYSKVSYDIWVYQPASIDANEVHEITLG